SLFGNDLLVDACRQAGSFCDDNHAEVASASVALGNGLGNLVQVEWALGNENHIGAAGDAAVDSDPAGVASHHFDDDYAVVRLGRRVYAVDGFGGAVHGGVECEAEVGAAEVVVDRLGNTADFESRLLKLVRDRLRVASAQPYPRLAMMALQR